MAKNATKVDATESATESVPSTFSWGDQKIEVTSLSGKALMYLIQYGANKSRQDSVAGMAKAMEKDGKEEADIKAAVDAAQAERLTAILEGTIGTRSGTGKSAVTSLEKMLARVAKERFDAAIASALAKKNASLPEGQPKTKAPTGETRDKMLAAFAEKNADAFKAEAERRLASTSEVDTDDLLGDL